MLRRVVVLFYNKSSFLEMVGENRVMNGEDPQAIGSGTWLLCETEALLIDENIEREIFEHVKSQANDEDLQIEEDGEERTETRTESGDYEFRVVDGLASLVKRVLPSKISEDASLSCENSHFTRNGSSILTAGEFSTSLRDETPSTDVRVDEGTLQLPHEDRLFQPERVEDYERNAGTFVGDDMILKVLDDFGLLPDNRYHVISNEGDGLCSQDCLTPSSSQLQPRVTENFEEDKGCRVVFERKLSFGNRESGPNLDETIWQSLPEDVAEKVLAWLPVASCARFRSVCKRWYIVMNSERFFQMQARNAAHETWVLSFGDPSSDVKHGIKYKGQVFDPISRRTFMLEFPFLPEYSVPVATAGGLVCFCCDSNSSGENDVSFYVCNPITKAWKFIPSQCSRVSIVTLVADSELGFMGYKLYVVCEASMHRWLWMGVLDHSTKEYDSKMNRWKDVGDLHNCEQFKSGSVFSHGKVHLLSSEIVQALDVQQGYWIEMAAPTYASCASLVEREGRLLVVGDMVHHNVFHLPNVRSYVGIVIWEFDSKNKDWNEVARMPEALVNNFPYSSFTCVIVGDFIYLFSRSESTPHIVVYSFSQHLWSWATNWCEEVPSKVFSFNPRLDACA